VPGVQYLAGMSSTEPPGPLLGAGRAADVFDIGNGRVLRRYRTSIDAGPEAEMMRHLDEAGFPVPKVYGTDGPDLVMERLDGRDMLAELGRKPWLAGRHGRLLARLHNRLHQIHAPDGWPGTLGSGHAVQHLDLHPGNVMLTSRGPVVIDWTNARAGAAGADVAMAYLIMASSEVDNVPAPVRVAITAVRSALIRSFLAGVADDPGPYLAQVARHRLQDRNVRPSEAAWLQRKAEEAERAQAAPAPG
jgi:aminoglycoside phosphotransferase (APT) family kinase protein